MSKTRDDAAMPRPTRDTKPAKADGGFKAINAQDKRAAEVEPMRTVTFALPVRVHNAMKQAALDHDTTLKALFQDALESHLERLVQDATGSGANRSGGAGFRDVPLH